MEKPTNKLVALNMKIAQNAFKLPKLPMKRYCKN